MPICLDAEKAIDQAEGEYVFRFWNDLDLVNLLLFGYVCSLLILLPLSSLMKISQGPFPFMGEHARYAHCPPYLHWL